MENEIQHVEVMAVEPNALAVMERAEIDIQISTAKKYPRKLSEFKQKATDMVSLDEETAASCIYRRPVGKEGGQMKYAEGESIREAEIVAACYGNLRYGSVISEMNTRNVKVIGFCHDLENNIAVKSEVVEATVTSSGQPYSERMRIVTAKAAQSKALRDAIFRVVPKSLCKSITQAARKIVLGENETIVQRREKVKTWMSKLSISTDRIFAALGIKGIEDVGEEQLITLTGIRTALKDGEVTLDEAFPEIPKEVTNTKQGVDGVKERIKKTDIKEQIETLKKESSGKDELPWDGPKN
jgi:hypothetical protein